ncbi:hypothetical protein ACI7RC_12765 [Brevibacillus sp. B_LB10_24]|uniref:hypothetical protein n=1 Tax=Brevibacillus sp. B_LB10_24 TaxID=3380645 RepID=UPI0038BA96AE
MQLWLARKNWLAVTLQLDADEHKHLYRLALQSYPLKAASAHGCSVSSTGRKRSSV